MKTDWIGSVIRLTGQAVYAADPTLQLSMICGKRRRSTITFRLKQHSNLFWSIWRRL